MRGAWAPTGLLLLLALALQMAQAPDPAASRKVARACATDAAQFCPDADSKGSVLPRCLEQHHTSLELTCRRALATAKGAAPGL